ncbi:MAG: hypothetical protein ABIR91_05970 [Candidatus Saccharimonadales bacterium]
MDIQAQSQQPLSDDQELAKVLAGVTQQNSDDSSMQSSGVLPTPIQDQSSTDSSMAIEPEIQMPELPPIPDAPTPMMDTPALAPATEPTDRSAPMTSGNDSLDAIKQEALGELRPLVDKLDVSPEEKFDTYLLLLRSTDDQDLIAPAHESARGIVDEARRAQALLDIIKEIDYLSAPS